MVHFSFEYDVVGTDESGIVLFVERRNWEGLIDGNPESRADKVALMRQIIEDQECIFQELGDRMGADFLHFICIGVDYD